MCAFQTADKPFRGGCTSSRLDHGLPGWADGGSEISKDLRVISDFHNIHSEIKILDAKESSQQRGDLQGSARTTARPMDDGGRGAPLQIPRCWLLC